MATTPRVPSTIDPADVARFDRLAAQWWDPWGPMRPLHKMNPLRATYVTELMSEAFDLPRPASPSTWSDTEADVHVPGRRSRSGVQSSDPGSRIALRASGNVAHIQDTSLAGQRILDIGCGGGLLAEALARRGADMTAIDPAANNIDVARAHAAKGGLAIDYRVTTAEALPADTAPFDAVLAMEVVEHVADRAFFLRTAANLVRPGGLLVLSTLNRTLKSFALAIVGAEYVLRWLPRGTHNWEQFVTPDELARDLRGAGLMIYDRTGAVYNPLFGEWRTSEDCDVNYFLAAERPV